MELDPMRKVCHLVGTSHVTLTPIENAPVAVLKAPMLTQLQRMWSDG